MANRSANTRLPAWRSLYDRAEPADPCALPAWFGDAEKKQIDMACIAREAAGDVSHDNILHTVLGMMHVETSVRDKSLDLVAPCRTGASSEGGRPDGRSAVVRPAGNQASKKAIAGGGRWPLFFLFGARRGQATSPGAGARLRPEIIAATRFSLWRILSKTTPHRCRATAPSIAFASASCSSSTHSTPQ